MEQFSNLQRLILKQLANGFEQNISSFSQRLSLPPAKIKHVIEELNAFGFTIETIDNQRFRLAAPLILLDERTLSALLLEKGFQTAYKLHTFSTINSTNLFLKSLAHDAYVHICCAEKQSSGRGRFGRYWHSPCAENIYCSSRWPIKQADLSGLSLVLSLALIAMLDDLNIKDVQIKWPNDLLWEDKKLSGILIEVLNQEAVIGIGININSDTLANPLPDKAWCSLFEMTGKKFDRNHIIALLLVKLEQYLQRFFQTGFIGFMQEWQRYDYLFKKNVCIKQVANTISGTCLGVQEKGELILEDHKQVLHYISSGEATLQY